LTLSDALAVVYRGRLEELLLPIPASYSEASARGVLLPETAHNACLDSLAFLTAGVCDPRHRRV